VNEKRRRRRVADELPPNVPDSLRSPPWRDADRYDLRIPYRCDELAGLNEQRLGIDADNPLNGERRVGE
jgi:hypothetical protein